MCVNALMSVVQCKVRYFKKVCLRALVNNIGMFVFSLNSVEISRICYESVPLSDK